MTNQTQTQQAATEKTRKRLTPAERMQKARDALRKAASDQRRFDTRSKVVLGGFTMGIARSNSSFAQQLLQALNTAKLREQDREALTDFRKELMLICNGHAKAQQNQNVG